MPTKNGKWFSVECGMEICTKWKNGHCESGVKINEENLHPNYSTCYEFELEDTKNKIIILEKNTFLYTSISVDNENYIFQGDITKYEDRLKFIGNGKVIRK